ncbi:DUF4270 family protein [Algoriphagus halophilus]|uniref:DUF4270 family protein n=1 Tax=Algoriphagus halophilus TaxID=226505 RepID=UPI00358EC8DE
MKSSTASTQVSPVKLAFLALLSIILTNSCSDPASVGIELGPGNDQIGVFFEEFEFPAEVVLLDSFNTTNKGNLIVGVEEDDYFGRTEGTGYTRMYISTAAERPESEAFLDSMLFEVDVISVNGSNLDEPKLLSIHRLTEPILDTVYYNFDKLAYEESPIASGEFVFGEVKDTVVSMPVNEEFQEELFGKMKRGLEFEDIFKFREFLPGMAFKGREGDNTSFGIDLNEKTRIITYYHYAGDTVSTSYEINTTSSRYFNNVDSDRSNTPTSVVTEPGKNYSTGSTVGLKSGLGMMIRLDTSPLDSFLDTISGVTFNQVLLTFGEIEEFPEGQTPPSSLAMYYTDANNNFLQSKNTVYLTVQADGQSQVYTNEDGDVVPNVTAPASVRFDSETNTYSELITSHVNAVFRGQLTRRDWLIYGGYISSPVGINNDPFRESLRQFKVGSDKVKVQVIYSKIR